MERMMRVFPAGAMGGCFARGYPPKAEGKDEEEREVLTPSTFNI
jgi:hypothetical protein